MKEAVVWFRKVKTRERLVQKELPDIVNTAELISNVKKH